MSIYDQHKPESTGGVYLKIQGGETVKVRIASEPAIFQSQGKDKDGNPTLTTRYAWKVWNQDNQTAQILQQSATFFNNIAALARDDDWGDPTNYDIKISREGSGFQDTKYSVTASPKSEALSDEAKKAVEDLDLLEKIKVSPYAQNVFMLAEWEEMQAKAPSKPASIDGVDSKKKDDITIEDMGDEPIDLNDIPF
jgi:hypothetical protein